MSLNRSPSTSEARFPREGFSEVRPGTRRLREGERFFSPRGSPSRATDRSVRAHKSPSIEGWRPSGLRLCALPLAAAIIGQPFNLSSSAHSSHRDQPIRLIVITDSGDRDHAAGEVEEDLPDGMGWHLVVTTDGCPLTFSPGVGQAFNRVHSRAAARSRRHDRGERIEVEFDDRLQGFSGGCAAQAVWQRLPPTGVVRL